MAHESLPKQQTTSLVLFTLTTRARCVTPFERNPPAVNATLCTAQEGVGVAPMHLVHSGVD